MNILIKLLPSLIIFISPFTSAEESKVTIDDFAFLTGYWQGSGMGGKSEDMWMPPSDGSMFGLFKQSNDDGLIFTEFLEIVEVDGEFILRLKHFNPDFSGWEEKNDHLTFRLSGLSENAAEFGGLRYRLTASRQLLIELDMNQSDGSSTTEEFLLDKK